MNSSHWGPLVAFNLKCSKALETIGADDRVQ